MEVWNKEAFGDVKIRKSVILREIGELDSLEECHILTDDQIRKMVLLRNEFEEELVREETSWR